MSKHTVTAGNMAGLLARFSELKRKAMVRTGKSYPIIVIQEAGLDGFWIRRVRLGQGIVSHVRIKGLLFSEGVSDHAPLRRDRRTRLEALRTGDGRALPAHWKAQISRELDRLELLLEQIRAVEAERDALLATADKAACGEAAAPQPVAMLLALKGIGAEFAAVLWSEGLGRHFANRRQVAAYAGLAATPWRSRALMHYKGGSKTGKPWFRQPRIPLPSPGVPPQPASHSGRWCPHQPQ